MVRTAKQTDRLNALESRCGDASGRLASVTALGHSYYLREVIHAISGRIHSRGHFGRSIMGDMDRTANLNMGVCYGRITGKRGVFGSIDCFDCTHLGKVVCRAIALAMVLVLLV